ncbi:catechol 2,3-dioxygenase-like lactoylglutathione lyase family enzyme [Bacillus oleivorans]|uniref:Catechol 2,3-dioxygenase-like lactoylglutathione lyase family enzyme n=1 Tax=Bacillus oleivorans TaxID=1448271 RepID=A0A285D6M4_9BACI|nr:VOC family protein [Bacillus oleivorans]SNX74813.1 catechol 2,3-dioxygenase-like lactoylglutathione lyase family enzyme [Bacillus oleivorans]
MVQSPIKNKIKSVFIPVRDIEKAKNWYSKILGIQDGEVMFDHLFVADMEGAGMVLDTMPMWRNEYKEISTFHVPAIQFATDDIQSSYQFMKENGVELVTEIQHDHFFVFKDPDGNMLMVCQD